MLEKVKYGVYEYKGSMSPNLRRYLCRSKRRTRWRVRGRALRARSSTSCHSKRTSSSSRGCAFSLHNSQTQMSFVPYRSCLPVPLPLPPRPWLGLLSSYTLHSSNRIAHCSCGAYWRQRGPLTQLTTLLMSFREFPIGLFSP